MTRTLAVLAAFCSLPGLGSAVLAMYTAWEHNPQGEFHELGTGGATVIHTGAWFGVGFSWFAAIFLLLFLIGGIVVLLERWLRRGR